MTTLTAIVPFYNEAQTILLSLQNLEKVDILDEIILIDDGSTDNSHLLVKDFCLGKEKFKVFSSELNKGKGSALQNAQNHINTKYVVIHDADLEYNPQDLYSMYNLVDGQNLVLGSRFIGDAHRTNIYKRTLLANKVMSAFFSVVHQKKISDVATCYKMMPSSFFKNIDFTEEGFSIEIEILSKFLKQNRSISEVPIQYNGRTYEQGKKIKTKDGFLYLFNTLKYRLR
jgi:glycosyltransferase involved in cell wall biosynthesis